MFVLPLFLLFSIVFAIPKCPLGATYSGKYQTCLFLPRFLSSWQGAEDYCEYMGGHLITIDSPEKNKYVLEFANLTQVAGLVTIGAYMKGLHWEWTDGSPFNYSNFDPSSPSSGPLTGATLQVWPSNHLNNRGLWYQEKIQNIDTQFLCTFPPCSDSPRTTLIPGTSDVRGFQHSNSANCWYLSFEDTGTFADAEAESICLEIGGHIPSIRNAFDNSQFRQIQNAIDKNLQFVLLGLNSDIDGIWSWTDGNNSTYKNWAANQPKLVASSYVMMAPDSSQWFTSPTKNKYQMVYSCELPIVPNIC